MNGRQAKAIFLSPDDPPPSATDLFALNVAATPAGVRHALLQTIGHLKNLGVAPAVLSDTELVLAEVLNNIVEHALVAKTDTSFSLQLWHRGTQLEFMTQDSGKPMPNHMLPAAGMPNLNVKRADLPEGGFGWPIFLTLAQNICYRRAGRTNALRFDIPLAAR